MQTRTDPRDIRTEPQEIRTDRWEIGIDPLRSVQSLGRFVEPVGDPYRARRRSEQTRGKSEQTHGTPVHCRAGQSVYPIASPQGDPHRPAVTSDRPITAYDRRLGGNVHCKPGIISRNHSGSPARRLRGPDKPANEPSYPAADAPRRHPRRHLTAGRTKTGVTGAHSGGGVRTPPGHGHRVC